MSNKLDDKTVEACVRELIRKSQHAQERYKLERRLYGVDYKYTKQYEHEAATYLEAARHLSQMTSYHPIHQLMKNL